MSVLFKDPDVYSVIVAIEYFVASFFCFSAWRYLGKQKTSDVVDVSQGEMSKQRRVWIGCCVVLLVLGINKQTDLHSWIDFFGREILRYFEIYTVRRAFQIGFIGIIALCLTSISVCFALQVRRWAWPYHLLAFGMGVQAAFVVLRAGMQNRFEFFRSMNVYHNALESVGLILVIFASVVFVKLRKLTPD